jgi:autotransporter-associated beta strand protein
LTNDSGGTIQSQGDAVRITATTLTGNPTGTFSIDNFGAIKSTGTGTNNGQAIDFNDLVSANGHVTITNESTGLIQAADADAIRPGTNATINNYGTVRSLNGTPTSTGNDGIDFQNSTGGVVNNFAGGLIDGARHGITGNNPITVDNAGTIIGHVGSGINMDIGSTTITTVLNEHTGVITGISVDGVQSGDAVDVDGQIQLDNHGLIQALGTSSGHTSEGVTVGGGTINNYADGTIYSSERGITFDGGGNLDGTNNPEFVASMVYNEGLIQGDSGEAIVIVGNLDDTITNRGTIVGSIAMDGGADTLNEYTGSSISGVSEGGAGADSINLLGTGSGTLSALTNFENLDVQGGNWTIVNDDAFSGGTTIAAGASLQIGNGGTAGSLASDVNDGGVLPFDRSDISTYSGSISGAGSVERAGSGTTILSGHSRYSGGTEIASGTLDVVQTDSAATGAITMQAHRRCASSRRR